MPSSFNSSSMRVPFRLAACGFALAMKRQYLGAATRAPSRKRQTRSNQKTAQNRAHRCDGGFQVVIDHLMLIFPRASQLRASVRDSLLYRFFRIRVPFSQPLFQRLEMRGANEDRHGVGTLLFYLRLALHV